MVWFFLSEVVAPSAVITVVICGLFALISATIKVVRF